MTKKVTYICDRCGEEFEEYDREVKISVKEVDDYDGEYWYRYLDLCPKCEKEMNVFFNNPGPTWEEKVADAIHEMYHGEEKEEEPADDVDWDEDND